jgi:Family of unknown function (DUF5947)
VRQSLNLGSRFRSQIVNENLDPPGFTDAGPQSFSPGQGLIKTLRRFREQSGSLQEKCEFCGVGLATEHRHLLEVSKNRIACTCSPCALRFQDVVGGRFKLIPRDIRRLSEFDMSDAEWENLALPINLAFFFYGTPQQKMNAMYPSPAGATESLLPLTAWTTLTEKNSTLTRMEADVEALLVNRVGTKRGYYIVPIDVCFELIGLIRLHWRGFSGGDKVWEEVERFFAKLDNNSCS